LCGRVLRLDFKLDECLEWDKCGDLRVVVGFYSGISAKIAWISAKIPIYQPTLLGYQPKF